MERFVRKAFRRPADDTTLDRLVNIAESVYKQPDKNFRAGRLGGTGRRAGIAAFSVPIEHADPKTPKGAAFAFIDEYSLASRLSYLLWSTMPDEELFRLAERGELRANLKPQVGRMLKDPRAAELSRNFAGQWLKSRNVDPRPAQRPRDLETGRQFGQGETRHRASARPFVWRPNFSSTISRGPIAACWN